MDKSKRKKRAREPTVRRRGVLAWGRRRCVAATHVVEGAYQDRTFTRALGVSPASRRVGDYGRRRCSRLDGHVGVGIVTAVDHGGVDAARVS